MNHIKKYYNRTFTSNDLAGGANECVRHQPFTIIYFGFVPFAWYKWRMALGVTIYTNKVEI